METISVEDFEDRIVVTLDRPEVLNSINLLMVHELHQVCDSLEQDPKVLILTGAQTPRGGVFAAGADISELNSRGREDALQGFNSDLFGRIAALPMPVVAAIDGFAIGGGAELAYAADIRIATRRTRIGNPEPRLGILAGAGACWRLAELVGEPLAKDMLFTGRILDAEEAYSIRLVTELWEPGELLGRAHDLADRMKELDPLAIRLTKLAIQAPKEAHPVVDNLAQAVLFESPEKTRRMGDFLSSRNKRK